MRQKNFRRSIEIAPPPLCINSFDTRDSPNQQRVPVRTFSELGDKQTSTKPWYPPPFIQNFFPYQNFFETQKCSPTKFFGTVRQSFPDEKTWYPPCYPWFFSTSETFWNTRGFPHEVFRHCEAKTFSWKKILPAIPYLIHKFFHTRNFLKDRRVPPRSLLALWDWNFPTEKSNTLPTIPYPIHDFFLTRFFLKHRRVPSRSFSVLRD